VKEAEGEALTSMVGYVLSYDKRDRPQRPTDGYYMFFGQDFAGLGGDVTYIRTTAGASYYYPITPSVVASLSAEGGYIHGLGQNVRLNDRFDVGGQNLRGFADAGIGPRDANSRDSLGGNVYGIGTAEVSFPVGLPDEYGIRASVFTDFGTLFEVDTSPTVSVLDDASLRMSAGIGISWDSPFGPIRVDFAQALLKEDYDETQVFRFSFGTKF
jgi:outer membrane protein insertion porin family